MSTTTTKATCGCTEPYSVMTEGGRGVSREDAYGHPVRGARRVWRCEHGREMVWDAALHRYVVRPTEGEG